VHLPAQRVSKKRLNESGYARALFGGENVELMSNPGFQVNV
jgi:hypothetical protein